MTIPFLPQLIHAGFPSPADDYIEAPINIHDYLITNPPATFLGRVAGNSMQAAGIYHNDIVVVDRSLTPKSDQVVVACVDGGFVVKFLRYQENEPYLCAADDSYLPKHINLNDELVLWGVVTSVIRQLV